MTKKFLENGQMSSAFVEDASRDARELVTLEMRGPGDFGNAMGRIEGLYGIPYWRLWGLLYKPPKRLDAALDRRIAAALQAHRARAERRRLGAEQNATARAQLHAAILRGVAAVGRGGDALRGGAAGLDRLADELAGEDDWPVIPG
jgi:hypothetical protein